MIDQELFRRELHWLLQVAESGKKRLRSLSEKTKYFVAHNGIFEIEGIDLFGELEANTDVFIFEPSARVFKKMWYPLNSQPQREILPDISIMQFHNYGDLPCTRDPLHPLCDHCQFGKVISFLRLNPQKQQKQPRLDFVLLQIATRSLACDDANACSSCLMCKHELCLCLNVTAERRLVRISQVTPLYLFPDFF